MQSATTFLEPRWPALNDGRGSPALAGLPQRPNSDRALQDVRSPQPIFGDRSLLDVVRRTTVCIASREQWAGTLGNTLLFQAQRTGVKRVTVGYFVYWTTERPWSKSLLPRQFFSAVATDAFYSHFFFVLPGLQRLLYGPGDIEGMSVQYSVDAADRLYPTAAFADNGMHVEVRLDVRDAVDAHGRFVALTDVWSHQLGARGAVRAVRMGARQQCYSGQALVALTPRQATEFRLWDAGVPRRALPAWREMRSATFGAGTAPSTNER